MGKKKRGRDWFRMENTKRGEEQANGEKQRNFRRHTIKKEERRRMEVRVNTWHEIRNYMK